MMTLRGVGHAVNYAIGAASETKQYLKEKRELEAEESEPSASSATPRTSTAPNIAGVDDVQKTQSVLNVSHNDTPDDSDDWDWELDEHANDLASQNPEDEPPSYENSTVVRENGNGYIGSNTLLPVPVVIPQRRPQHRTRGFVQAYAPVLGKHKGLDEQVFMNFLAQLNNASKSSHVYDAINLAAFIVGVTTPQVIGTPISFAVSFAAGTAREMQRRWQTNTFLDTANERIFKPHGLYAMVLTYKPNRQDEPVVQVDLDQVAATRNARGEASEKKKGLRFKETEAGTSRGEMSIPQAAPLIYPALEEAHEASSSTQEGPDRRKFMSYRAYMADYLDRRRQAKFAVANPNHPFSQIPEKPFASNFADPNHQMYHHGPINMVTGGHVDLWKTKREQRVALAEKQAGRPLTEAERIRASFDRGFTTPAAFARRLISENLLYLVICNEPTEEQMETARQMIDKAKQKGKVDDSPDSRDEQGYNV